jgi:hypothetical protein
VIGAVRAQALPMAAIHAIAPWPGRTAAVAVRLGGFPAPGRLVDTPTGRLAWAGRETAFLWGTPPDLADLAAVTDQSDAWAGVVLQGSDAAEALSRLVAVDLATLAPPAAIRAQLNHLPLLLIHSAPETYELWSYRSMAGTLVHEIEATLRGLAARRALG